MLSELNWWGSTTSYTPCSSPPTESARSPAVAWLMRCAAQSTRASACAGRPTRDDGTRLGVTIRGRTFRATKLAGHMAWTSCQTRDRWWSLPPDSARLPCRGACRPVSRSRPPSAPSGGSLANASGRHAVKVAPSLSPVQDSLRPKLRLPASRASIRRSVFRGEEASADAVLAALDGALLAHIAAHGIFRSDNPMFSSLRLYDGPITVIDLQRLKSAPRGRYPSSCDSGSSSHVGQDEILGMANALIPQGTSSMLAAVVPINDENAASFAIRFHRELRSLGSMAAALRTAGREATTLAPTRRRMPSLTFGAPRARRMALGDSCLHLLDRGANSQPRKNESRQNGIGRCTRGLVTRLARRAGSTNTPCARRARHIAADSWLPGWIVIPPHRPHRPGEGGGVRAAAGRAGAAGQRQQGRHSAAVRPACRCHATSRAADVATTIGRTCFLGRALTSVDVDKPNRDQKVEAELLEVDIV